jgi:hypothetical protein
MGCGKPPIRAIVEHREELTRVAAKTGAQRFDRSRLAGNAITQLELGDRLSSLDKKSLSESDICDLFISPAIKRAGWDPITQIRREVTLTPGPVIVRGNVASRNKKKKKFADYVLYQEPSVPNPCVQPRLTPAVPPSGVISFSSAVAGPADKSRRQ